MKIFLRAGVAFVLLAGFICASRPLRAQEEEFYCEVMSLEGTATVSNSTVSGKPIQEGDVLKTEDLITVGAGSYVDLAYDKDWNNVTRVEENSKVRLRSLYPTTVELEEGGVFAKLKSLPKDSTFEVKTPTAIASVRGTEYRTTFLSGETQIYNVSDSDVYVYGLDDSGSKQQAEPVVLKHSQATAIQSRGVAPKPPRAMQEREFQPVKKFQEGIERKVQQNITQGRFARIQDVRTVERIHEERRNREQQNRQEGNEGDRSRGKGMGQGENNQDRANTFRGNGERRPGSDPQENRGNDQNDDSAKNDEMLEHGQGQNGKNTPRERGPRPAQNGQQRNVQQRQSRPASRPQKQQ